MNDKTKVCPRCNGSKVIADANHPGGSAAGPNWIDCPDCKGPDGKPTGRVPDDK